MPMKNITLHFLSYIEYISDTVKELEIYRNSDMPLEKEVLDKFNDLRYYSFPRLRKLHILGLPYLILRDLVRPNPIVPLFLNDFSFTSAPSYKSALYYTLYLPSVT
jgi:hypothetical protein